MHMHTRTCHCIIHTYNDVWTQEIHKPYVGAGNQRRACSSGTPFALEGGKLGGDGGGGRVQGWVPQAYRLQSLVHQCVEGITLSLGRSAARLHPLAKLLQNQLFKKI